MTVSPMATAAPPGAVHRRQVKEIHDRRERRDVAAVVVETLLARRPEHTPAQYTGGRASSHHALSPPRALPSRWRPQGLKQGRKGAAVRLQRAQYNCRQSAHWVSAKARCVQDSSDSHQPPPWKCHAHFVRLAGFVEVLLCTQIRGGVPSRRRDCHFADAPFPSILERLLKGEVGAAE